MLATGLLGALIGAGLGAWMARRRGGDRADMAQYAAGYGIALGILGMFAGLFLLLSTA